MFTEKRYVVCGQVSTEKQGQTVKAAGGRVVKGERDGESVLLAEYPCEMTLPDASDLTTEGIAKLNEFLTDLFGEKMSVLKVLTDSVDLKYRSKCRAEHTEASVVTVRRFATQSWLGKVNQQQAMELLAMPNKARSAKLDAIFNDHASEIEEFAGREF